MALLTRIQKFLRRRKSFSDHSNGLQQTMQRVTNRIVIINNCYFFVIVSGHKKSLAELPDAAQLYIGIGRSLMMEGLQDVKLHYSKGLPVGSPSSAAILTNSASDSDSIFCITFPR